VAPPPVNSLQRGGHCFVFFHCAQPGGTHAAGTHGSANTSATERDDGFRLYDAGRTSGNPLLCIAPRCCRSLELPCTRLSVSSILFSLCIPVDSRSFRVKRTTGPLKPARSSFILFLQSPCVVSHPCCALHRLRRASGPLPRRVDAAWSSLHAPAANSAADGQTSCSETGA
jgi:hypothetical protein